MAEKTFDNSTMAIDNKNSAAAGCGVGSDDIRWANDTDAALSLCALGRLTCNESRPRPHEQRSKSNGAKTFHSVGIDLPTPGVIERAAVVTPIIAQSPVSRRVAQGLTQEPQTEKLEKVAAHADSCKKNVKPRDPKRDTSVSFEEMKRLMRVYGPIKALRNRKPKDTGKAAKPESIRRKFYRWFPDFNERFLKTSAGWFTPKAGHQQEMHYRESMRKVDQEILVKKRNDKRYNYRGIRQNRNNALVVQGVQSRCTYQKAMDERI